MMDEDLHGKWYSSLLQAMMVSEKTSEETGVPRVVGIEILPTGEVRHQIQIPSSKPRHGQHKRDHREYNPHEPQGGGILGECCDTSGGPCGEVDSSFGLLGGEVLDSDPNANRDQAQNPTDRTESEEKERDKSEHQLDRKK